MRDLHNNLDFKRAISPVSVSDNTARVGEIIDLQDYLGVEFVILTGNLPDADGTFTVLVEHGEQANLSDAAAVPDEDLLGTEAQASFTFADDNKVKKIGYKRTKRYVRLTITPANVAAGAELIAAVAVLSPLRKPSPTL